MGVENRVKILEDQIKILAADMKEQRKALGKIMEIVLMYQKIMELAQKSMGGMKK